MNGAIYFYFGHTALTQGSFEDLAQLGIKPQEGLLVSLYDLDADDENRPSYLRAEGVLYRLNDGSWHAKVDESTFRWVLRSEADPKALHR